MAEAKVDRVALASNLMLRDSFISLEIASSAHLGKRTH